MKVDLSTLLRAKGNSLKVNIEGDPDLCTSLSDDILKFNKVTVNGILENLSDMLTFKGQLYFSYVARCGRCLAEVEQEFTIDVEDSFYSDTSAATAENDYFYNGRELDLSRFIFDNIALTIPLKHLCSEVCKGICPKCGKNLNLEECSCKDEYIDPRLEKLKDLLK